MICKFSIKILNKKIVMKELSSILVVGLGGFIVYEALTLVHRPESVKYDHPMIENGFADDKMTFLVDAITPHYRLNDLTATYFGPNMYTVGYGNAVIAATPKELQSISPKKVTVLSNPNNIVYN